MTVKHRLWPVLLATALNLALLLGLGFWQLQRLQWKDALLAEIAARAAQPPLTLAEAVQRRAAGDDVDYMRATASGTFQRADEKLMMSGLEGNPAWEVITPLITADGHLLLVDRGVVPDTRKNPAARADGNPLGEVEIAGLLRSHATKPGFFTPANDPKANQWFWWDVPALLAATPTPPGVAELPFVLQITPQPGDKGYPRPQAAAIGIANNHLQYAITWFALAGVLVVIAGLHIRGQMSKPGA